jgi:hypothetical protein
MPRSATLVRSAVAGAVDRGARRHRDPRELRCRFRRPGGRLRIAPTRCASIAARFASRGRLRLARSLPPRKPLMTPREFRVGTFESAHHLVDFRVGTFESAHYLVDFRVGTFEIDHRSTEFQGWHLRNRSRAALLQGARLGVRQSQRDRCATSVRSADGAERAMAASTSGKCADSHSSRAITGRSASYMGPPPVLRGVPVK